MRKSIALYGKGILLDAFCSCCRIQEVYNLSVGLKQCLSYLAKVLLYLFSLKNHESAPSLARADLFTLADEKLISNKQQWSQFVVISTLTHLAVFQENKKE